MATYHCSVKHGSKGSGASSAAKADYICREGKYKDKPDMEHAASGNMPEWAQEEPRAFWQATDEHERANGRVYTEIEVALPREITPEQRIELVDKYIQEQIGDSHPFTVAIHTPKATLDGGDQPHAHIIFSERKLDGIERNEEQFFKRANAKEPEKGGTAKDRTWNEREKVQQIRESWEQHYNRHSPEPVSCRSLKEQGIGREPERHLGPKMARPDAPEAGRVMETREDLKKLEEIKREMQGLSREIEKDRIDQAKAVPLWQQDPKPYEWGNQEYEKAYKAVVKNSFDEPYQAETERLREQSKAKERALQKAEKELKRIQAKTFKFESTVKKAEAEYLKAQNEFSASKRSITIREEYHGANWGQWTYMNRSAIDEIAKKSISPEALAAREKYQKITKAAIDHKVEQQVRELKQHSRQKNKGLTR